MDIVITYVNGADKEWQRLYSQATNRPIDPERYRDWGFMPYLFRGIERYMPFVERVFLVVSSQSQVPEWVNRENVRVVLHEQIIPAQYLPTFNSTTIELFLHRIPDLSEQFIYFNDDCYPVKELAPEEFFVGDKIVMKFRLRTTLRKMNIFKKQRYQADCYARQAVGLERNNYFYRCPLHTCTPMLKSAQEQAFNAVEQALKEHITPLRREDNVNQYFYSDFLFHSHRAIDKRPSFLYCNMAKISSKKITQLIVRPTYKILCINDVPAATGKQQQITDVLKKAFERAFPCKSRFEK